MDAFNHLRPLAGLALMASLMTATATANSGIFEVDLLFPRNETYTPQALMPLVFALQSPILAQPLRFTIEWGLWEGNYSTSPGADIEGSFDSLDSFSQDSDNLSVSDPYFITSFTDTRSRLDGTWTLSWFLQANNCTTPPPRSNDTTAIQQNGSIVFTVSSLGQAPDLVAATSVDVCSSAPAYAFNMTSLSNLCGYAGGLLGSSPTTNPCAASIDAAAASSMYAKATVAACLPYQPVNPNITCPSFSAKPSASSHSAAASTLLALIAMLTALIHVG